MEMSKSNFAFYPDFQAGPNSTLAQTLLALLIISPMLLVVIGFRPAIAAIYFAVPLGFWLVSSSRAIFLIFLISIGLTYRIHVGIFVLQPSDILVLLCFFAVALEFLLRDRSLVRKSNFDLPFIALILASLLSIIFAFDITQTVTPTLRIVGIYLAFRLVFKMALEIGVRRVLLYYIYLVTALSIYNCWLFLQSGGSVRIFGPAWLTFETFAMTALPATLAFIIWSESQRERVKLSAVAVVIGIALVATQSRAPLVAVAMAVPFILWLAKQRGAGKRKLIRLRHIILAGTILIGVGTTLALVVPEIFAGWAERVSMLLGSVFGAKGTVALRLVLWKAALEGFAMNPLTGIGVGNFRIIDQMIPSLKLIPVWYYINGLSVHNVVLQYLAETGILGASAIVALSVIGIKSSYRCFRAAKSSQDIQLGAALLVLMFVFAVTIWYVRAWTWGPDGYIMALIFGLNAAWQYRQHS